MIVRLTYFKTNDGIRRLELFLFGLKLVLLI